MCTGYFHCFSINTVATVLPGGTYFTGAFPVKERKVFYTHRTAVSIEKKNYRSSISFTFNCLARDNKQRLNRVIMLIGSFVRTSK